MPDIFLPVKWEKVPLKVETDKKGQLITGTLRYNILDNFHIRAGTLTCFLTPGSDLLTFRLEVRGHVLPEEFQTR